ALEISDRIKLLADKDESIAAFAKKSGISDQLFRKYIAGSIPGGIMLLKIATAGNVSVDWILTGEKAPASTTATAAPGEWTLSTKAMEEYPELKKCIAEINENAEVERPFPELVAEIKASLEKEVRLYDIKKRTGTV
ncbi:MAG: hypothetical protein KJ882_04985, partial [Proteobacteria bacterium]|nr:hypothetical protein [Pseudomonadota bacterium]